MTEKMTKEKWEKVQKEISDMMDKALEDWKNEQSEPKANCLKGSDADSRRDFWRKRLNEQKASRADD